MSVVKITTLYHEMDAFTLLNYNIICIQNDSIVV